MSAQTRQLLSDWQAVAAELPECEAAAETEERQNLREKELRRELESTRRDVDAVVDRSTEAELRTLSQDVRLPYHLKTTVGADVTAVALATLRHVPEAPSVLVDVTAGGYFASRITVAAISGRNFLDWKRRVRPEIRRDVKTRTISTLDERMTASNERTSDVHTRALRATQDRERTAVIAVGRSLMGAPTHAVSAAFPRSRVLPARDVRGIGPRRTAAYRAMVLRV